MKAVQYLAPLVFLPLTASAVFFGGWWSFNVPLVAFVMVPLVELISKGTGENFTAEEEEKALNNPLYDIVVYSVVPLQLAVLTYYLWTVSSGTMDTLSFVGATLSMGISCGTFGINVGHELGHRKTWYEQWMAKTLLFTSMYMHFFIEHNRGHHKRVATEEDPATARYGETVFAFWLRSMTMGYISAWKIENLRLSKKNKNWFSLGNEMLQLQLIQIVGWVTVFFVLSPLALVAWFVVSLMGILLLETVNYLEHYGLTRKQKDNGRYERVLPIHSWNSNHSLGRLLLFEVTRHSDHHAHSNRRYQILRHFEESPQLPTGYPGMILLALCPPLWFSVMHPHIEQYNKRYQQISQTPQPASA